MIQLEQVNKKFDKKVVLDQLNLTIENNQIYCLLGKNGAGKTTLINLILDLIEPDSGKILINNKHNYSQYKQLANLFGVVGDTLLLLEEVSGYDYLRFIGQVHQIDKNELEKRIADLVEFFFEHESDLKKSIVTYSTGMKKKIAFCAAVLHTPQILVLDEPFSGLDPFVANQMIQFILKYKREDRIIFISSHDLAYIEKVATHIGVLNEGQLIYNASSDDFTSHGASSIDAALLTLLKPNESQIDKLDWI